MVLGCYLKLSVVCTQNGHKYLFPPQDFVRLWQGFRLVVADIWHQFIALLDLKYPSIYSHKPIFVDFTCLYCIYWISAHWSWNFSLGLIVNFLWAVSKPDICIFFPWRFLESHDTGAGCVITLVVINWLNDFKATTSRFWWKFGVLEQFLVLESAKGALRPI